MAFDVERELAWPPVVEVLQHYGVNAAPRAGWAKCLCPFHDDRHPSATFNTGYNVFYCHACSISTSGLGVIMQKEGLDIVGARQYAEGVFGAGDPSVRVAKKHGNPLLGGARSGGGGRSEVPSRRRYGGLLDGA